MHWKKNTISTISTSITDLDQTYLDGAINDGSEILRWFTLIVLSMTLSFPPICITNEIHWQFVWDFYKNARYTKIYVQEKV